MTGSQWMDQLLFCAEARRRIPLGLQPTLPLPGRKGDGSVECWYYRLECGSDGVQVYSPARYALWDAGSMTILKLESLKAEALGSGDDTLTRESREREDAYLSEVLEPWLRQGRTPCGAQETMERWLEAAPQAMRTWLSKSMKEA